MYATTLSVVSKLYASLSGSGYLYALESAATVVLRRGTVLSLSLAGGGVVGVATTRDPALY